ncbi:hypothetical protein B0H14DRAFT_2596811 [Mycena olivaceomarginata]|nr:hypothetical protein B0H14DRAFT_2596811 [Mycena olivaceomarginata]
MPLVKDLLDPIVNYRLGYAPTRPYAWRWTTPVAFMVSLVATTMFALINSVSRSTLFVITIHHRFAAPLSAYTTVSEATYTPNASLPALPLSGLVPSILQESSYSGSFSPQTLSTGQIIRPNGSIFSYNITGAYNFPTRDLFFILQQSAFLRHYYYDDTCQHKIGSISSIDVDDDIRFRSLYFFSQDLSSFGLFSWTAGLFGEAPRMEQMIYYLRKNGTVFFKPFNGTAFAVLDTLLHNFFQALYHTIRLDLGISQPNQIYTSAEMYNQNNEEVESLRETVEQMRETIEQMRRGLDKHGLIGDDAESEDMNSWKTSHEEVSLMRRYSRAHNNTYSNA